MPNVTQHILAQWAMGPVGPKPGTKAGDPKAEHQTRKHICLDTFAYSKRVSHVWALGIGVGGTSVSLYISKDTEEDHHSLL